MGSVLIGIVAVFVVLWLMRKYVQANPTGSPEQVLGNPAAPYFNSLITPGNSNAAQVSYCTHYYNAGVGVHGSEPNYVDNIRKYAAEHAVPA